MYFLSQEILMLQSINVDNKQKLRWRWRVTKQNEENNAC